MSDGGDGDGAMELEHWSCNAKPSLTLPEPCLKPASQRERGRQTDRQTDRQTGRQTDTQTDKQPDSQADSQPANQPGAPGSH